jgi:hypothetical protein
VPIVGNILTVAAAALCGPGAAACAAIAASVTSAIVTGLASGDLGFALKSGLIAAATAVAFNVAGKITGALPGGSFLPDGSDGPTQFLSEAHGFNIVSHAAIGCASSVASGGKCGPGALSGAVGSFTTPLTEGLSSTARLAAVTVAGGLASVAGGGKFGNGAVTAAFGYLYNAVAGRLVGGYVGASLSATPCAATGLLAPACVMAGRYLGGALGSGIEDWLDGTLWNESNPSGTTGNAPRSDLPRAPNGNYLPDPDAEGPHSTLGYRTGRRGEVYRQGATFDADGNFQGRTDVTSHPGHAGNHPNPHFHSATSPNSVSKVAEPVPWLKY